MTKDGRNTRLGQDFESGRDQWKSGYEKQVPGETPRRNRSGIEVKPLYTPEDWNPESYMPDLGFPGDTPFTRGIYPSMHRGRSWTQRQLIGLATPEDYNARMRRIVDTGATALSVIPCNSVYRGYDIDEVDVEIVGTCGTTINTVEDMETFAWRGVPIGDMSIALNDPSPFTLLACMLCVATANAVGMCRGTAISGHVEPKRLHLALRGQSYVSSAWRSKAARTRVRRSRGLCEQTYERLPMWNPVSVVGQHMQQSGATPAEAMAFTLASAVQYAEDCQRRGTGRGCSSCRASRSFLIFRSASLRKSRSSGPGAGYGRGWPRNGWGAKDPRCLAV